MKVLIASAALVFGSALTACSSQPGASASAQITVRGTIYLQGGGGWSQASGPCQYGPSPVQAILTDGSHAVLANTQVFQGTLRDAMTCMIPFTFVNVPAGKNEYGVSVNGLGPTWFSASQITKPIQVAVTSG
jgi:hypothetical protein